MMRSPIKTWQTAFIMSAFAGTLAGILAACGEPGAAVGVAIAAGWALIAIVCGEASER